MNFEVCWVVKKPNCNCISKRNILSCACKCTVEGWFKVLNLNPWPNHGLDHGYLKFWVSNSFNLKNNNILVWPTTDLSVILNGETRPIQQMWTTFFSYFSRKFLESTHPKSYKISLGLLLKVKMYNTLYIPKWLFTILLRFSYANFIDHIVQNIIKNGFKY